MEKITFYAIEGLDGVGKTTLVNNLSKKGFLTFKTPSDDYSYLRKKVHSLNKSSLFFYLSSLAYLFEKEIKQKDNFFIDRYLFSTIGNFAFKNNLSIEEVDKLFEEFYNFLPKPKFTIFLTLNYEERINRINLRNVDNNCKNFDNLDLKYNNYILDMMKNYKFPKIIINTNNPKEIIMNEVLKHI